MSRAWFMAVPLLTVLVVAYAMLVAGAPRELVAARVYGGPTEARDTLSLRIEVVQRSGEFESPFWTGPITVQVRSVAGQRASARVSEHVHGIANVNVDIQPTRAALQLEVSDGAGRSLAQGAVSLDVARWALRARRRGGWIRGRSTGALALSVAPERGAFVVGSLDPLVVRVERSEGSLSDIALSVTAEGARVTGVTDLHSDAQGRAHLSLEPSELNPTLHIEARASDGETGSIHGGIPVVPGGFHGRATGAEVRVESATPRNEAFFSVVCDRGRLWGGVLALQGNAHGSSGTVLLPAIRAQDRPAWIVLSSDVDLNSAAAIGWPLESGAEPAQTFDVPDYLLLDGLPAAFAREQERHSAVRWLSAAFILLAFLLSVALLVVRVRAADREIKGHLSLDLDLEAVQRAAPSRFWSLVVALLAIALGFIALGLLMAARIH